METPPKYPRTPHWPWSATIHSDDKTHQNPERFAGRSVLITEKMDGGNTCLFNGEVYARSVSSPSRNAWMSMVRKHHAHKTLHPDYKDVALYGEDIFGVHSIEYNPVRENETFMLFAAQDERYLSILRGLDIHLQRPRSCSGSCGFYWYPSIRGCYNVLLRDLHGRSFRNRSRERGFRYEGFG